MGRAIAKFFKHALTPPEAFTPASLEESFLADHAARFAPNRRFAFLLAIVAWLAYGAWDLVHYDFGMVQGRRAYLVLALRAGGGFFLICLARATFSKKMESEHYATTVLSAAVVMAYTVILLMMILVTFPMNYLFYFTGLTLVFLFMFGLLRIGSTAILKLIAYCAFSSFFILNKATHFDRYGVAPTPHFELSQAFVSIASYYFWSAETYIISFLFLGYILSVEIEKVSRDEFRRERELFLAHHEAQRSHDELSAAYADLETSQQTLSGAYDQLAESQRETSSRTDALIEAQKRLREQAERENSNKSKFLADAAHDLRQPTQALSSYLAAAEHAARANEVERCLELLDSAKRAFRLQRSSFNAVLDISRLESGYVKADLSDFHINDLLEEIVGVHEAQARDQGVSLRMRPTGQRAIIRSDRQLASRLISNLVSNGIKYGRREIGKNQVVIVGAVRFANRVRIDIVDNGIGIADVNWEAIFQPFKQLDNKGRDRDMGLGLGLSIVSAIIPLLPEHRFDMRSNLGRGTRFSLEMPLGKNQNLPRQSDITIEERSSIDVDGIYILYVEDDVLVREANVALFESVGILVDTASSVNEFLQLLTTVERPPDMIVSDFRLGKRRTGQDVIAAARSTYGADLPALVITGEVSDLTSEHWVRPGKVLRKPVPAGRLIEQISTLCRRQ